MENSWIFVKYDIVTYIIYKMNLLRKEIKKKRLLLTLDLKQEIT